METSLDSKNGTRLLFGLPAVFKEGYWIVFSSDFQNLARVSQDRIDLPETYNELLSNGFFLETKKSLSKNSVVNVTLILTNDCNLRCGYCFVEAGDFTKKVITLDIIVAALKRAAIISKGRKISVSFFGGEPTTEFKLIQQAVEFAEKISKEKGLPSPEFSIVSNGIFGQSVHEFLVQKKFLITLSVDGPSLIQNFQRPALHGDSSKIVEKTIKRFAEIDYQIKIRVTVTKFSVYKMEDIVAWYSHFGFKSPEVHFEPVSISGRARSLTDETGKPPASDFLANLKKAIEKGNLLGVGVINSSFMNLINTPSEFCESNIDNRFAVTPDGGITKCVEVQDRCHPAVGSFLLAEYDQKINDFRFFEEKLTCGSPWQAIQFKSQKGNDCSGCFVKNICGGGCPVRNFHATGEVHTVDSYRCEVTMGIIPYIYKMIDDKSSQQL